jgi:hypothetical protein
MGFVGISHLFYWLYLPRVVPFITLALPSLVVVINHEREI